MNEKKIKEIRLRDGEVCVAIIHYNTPELTHGCIGSLIYNGGLSDRLRVVVFDNSDREPFAGASGVTIIDNTKGQYIDFEKELAKFPDKDRSIGCAKGCEFGSVKHMMTVQKLWEMIPQGFILMESDIFIKKSIAEFVQPQYSFVGYAQQAQPHNPFGIGRVLPMLCYMNVPLLTKYGARYYDPARTYGLLPGGRQNRQNWYDTGAVMLEDIIAKRPHLKGLHMDIRPYIDHYGSASWQNNDRPSHEQWMEARVGLLPAEERRKEISDQCGMRGPVEIEYERPDTVAVCAIGRLENRYAREWIDHYKQLGVDKIFIYDNNREGEENFMDVLTEDEIKTSFVEIIYWDGNQKSAYEDCYQRFGQDYGWIGFFDFDELLRFHELTKFKVKDFLKMFYSDVVVINWRLMTDNGQMHYDPRPLSERFTEAAPKDIAINHHVKSFVRGGIEGISFNDPHIPNAPELTVVNTIGVQVQQKPIQEEVIHTMAWIDHYDTKSTEEWVAKVKRGWCDVNATMVKQRQDHAVDYYFSINKRTAEKEAILGVKPAGEPTGTVAAKPSKPKTMKSTNRKGK